MHLVISNHPCSIEIATRDVSDEELCDAVNRKYDENHDWLSIRILVSEFASEDGQVQDIPRHLRRGFLTRLKQLGSSRISEVRRGLAGLSPARKREILLELLAESLPEPFSSAAWSLYLAD